MTASPPGVVDGEAEALDDAQFDALHRSLAGEIYRYAARRTTHEIAQDVVAEVFVALWVGRDKIPDPLDEQRAWVFGVARRQLARATSAEARHHRLLDRVRLGLRRDHALTEEDVAVQVLASAAAREAWRALSLEDREILSLIAWEQLSPREVAFILDLKLSAVTSRLHRARKRLIRANSKTDGRDR